MVKIILNKKDDFSWKKYGLRKLAEIEEMVLSDKDLSLSYYFFEHLKNNNVVFENIKYVNDYGMTNYWIEKNKKSKNSEIISYSFSLSKLAKDDFIFENKIEKIKNKTFSLSSISTLYELQTQLLNWKGEETIIFNNLEKNHKAFLKKWCSFFSINWKEEKKISLDNIFIKGTEQFANLKFRNNVKWKEFEIYSDPTNSNYKKLISQKTIIDSIVHNSLLATSGKNYKDHFITAPTGSGKSLIFQSAAYFLAKKYKLLTIIISPLKSLMQDQVESWTKFYKKVGAINSDLNVIERNKIVEDIKNSKINIVYIAPESLISNDYRFLFGERQLGLLIVDEAHIVTTWGKGFRPDYWYLDKWILKNRKNQKFQIATFTATSSFSESKSYAMNKETVRNLCMMNPIEIIAPAYRDDIRFEITIEKNNDRLSKEDYREMKLNFLLKELNSNKKTIVYFPYKAYVKEASRFLSKNNVKHSIYHGSLDKNEKKENFENFRKGTTIIMLATKAFGMGIDIEDIEVVSHFAPTGLINDYLQEIGRAARKPNLEGIGSMLTILNDNGVGWNDFTFINRLYGMSAIRNENIKKVIRTIKNIYEKKQKGSYQESRFLVPMDNFISSNFDGTKVKTAFLMIQRDIEKFFKYVGLVIRPYMIMTEIIVEKLDPIFSDNSNFKSIIDKYFISKLYPKIYSFNMKRMWEDHFKELSFPFFKFLFLAPYDVKIDEIDEKTKSNIVNLKKVVSPRQILVFKDDDHFEKIKDSYYLSENIIRHLFSTTNLEIDETIIEKTAKKFQVNKFQIIEFLDSLYNYYVWVDKNRYEGIGLFNPIKKNHSLNYNYLIKRKNGIVRPLYLDLINIKSRKSNLKNTYILPMSINKKDAYIKWIFQLKIFEIWNKFSVELKSGTQPMVYISVNAPTVFDHILNENYHNSYVTEAMNRFVKGKEIMRDFLTKKMTNAERKTFIENIFLFRDPKYDN